MKIITSFFFAIAVCGARPNFYSTVPVCNWSEVARVKEYIEINKVAPTSETWNGDVYELKQSEDQKPLPVKVLLGTTKDFEKRRLSLETEIEIKSLLSGAGATPGVDCYYFSFQKDRTMIYFKEFINGSNVKAIFEEDQSFSLQFYNPHQSSLICKWAEMAIAMAQTLSQFHSEQVVALSSMLEDWVLTDQGNVLLDNMIQSRFLTSTQPVLFPFAPEQFSDPKDITFKTDVYYLGHLLHDLFQVLHSFRVRQLKIDPGYDPKVAGKPIQPILDKMQKKLEEDRVTLPETINLLDEFQKEHQCSPRS